MVIVVVIQSLSRIRLFATPWTVARGSSVPGISQARILEWIAISFCRTSSAQGWNPRLLHPRIGRQILYC